MARRSRRRSTYFRYRRPSLKTALGITRAKRRFRKTTGYYAATRWTRAPQNAKRRMLRRAHSTRSTLDLL